MKQCNTHQNEGHTLNFLKKSKLKYTHPQAHTYVSLKALYIWKNYKFVTLSDGKTTVPVGAYTFGTRDIDTKYVYFYFHGYGVVVRLIDRILYLDEVHVVLTMKYCPFLVF